jgi:haloalkane dehalogenase
LASAAPAATSTAAAEGEISAAYPFQPKRLDVGNTFLSYVDVGDGDPFVLLHGNPTWSYLWRNVIPGLSRLGRCIAPDLVGMGRSGKPPIRYDFFEQFKYLSELIWKLRLDRITFVLHDQGSTLGFHYANLNRSNVQGLVFMEALL